MPTKRQALRPRRNSIPIGIHVCGLAILARVAAVLIFAFSGAEIAYPRLNRVNCFGSEFLMDPVTHGITGALLGKGYFSERYGRVAVFAATLGAVFPDVDVAADIVSRDPLAIVKYHRAITHSLDSAAGFCFSSRASYAPDSPMAEKAQRAIPRHRIAAAGNSHTDLRHRDSQPHRARRHDVFRHAHVVSDFERARGVGPAVHHRPYVHGHFAAAADAGADLFRRAIDAPRVSEPKPPEGLANMDLVYRGHVAAWLLTKAASYPFRLWVAALVSVILAGFIFLPAIKGWGFRVTRARWCQAGP